MVWHLAPHITHSCCLKLKLIRFGNIDFDLVPYLQHKCTATIALWVMCTGNSHSTTMYEATNTNTGYCVICDKLLSCKVCDDKCDDNCERFTVYHIKLEFHEWLFSSHTLFWEAYYQTWSNLYDQSQITHTLTHNNVFQVFGIFCSTWTKGWFSSKLFPKVVAHIGRQNLMIEIVWCLWYL